MATPNPQANLQTPPNPLAKSPSPANSHPSASNANLRSPEPSLSPDTVVVYVPSYARWFSFDEVHQCEVRFLPEFFDSKSPSKKSPRIYRYYRNSMVQRYRADPRKKMSFTEARRTLVGDAGSIRRVFDFLEGWGLINYSPPAINKPLKWDDREAKAMPGASHGEAGGGPLKEERAKRVCNHCKSVCSIACFVCDKNNMTLCARCYVRGNYELGDASSSGFRRVEINEDSKTDWSDRDNLHLLEALMHYGDDWKKVARHVGRGEKECVSNFLKLPFGEEFAEFAYSGDDLMKDHGEEESCTESPAKRMCLSPLADASNPIMAQAAFLSALAGGNVAEAAAQAAVAALSDTNDHSVRENRIFHIKKSQQPETVVSSNGKAAITASEGATADAESELGQEERDVEAAISGIVDVQMKEIKEKIDRFEDLDRRIEKEWQQMEQMKNLLFVDQLNLFFHKDSAKKSGDETETVIID